jgi:hypothetical protein
VRRHAVHGRVTLRLGEEQLHHLRHEPLAPPSAAQAIAEVDDVRLRPTPAADPDRATTLAQFDEPGGLTADIEHIGDDATGLVDVGVRAPRHIARHFRVGSNALEPQLGIVEVGRAQRDSWTVEHLDVRHGYIVHRCRRAADGG